MTAYVNRGGGFPNVSAFLGGGGGRLEGEIDWSLLLNPYREFMLKLIKIEPPPKNVYFDYTVLLSICDDL